MFRIITLQLQQGIAPSPYLKLKRIVYGPVKIYTTQTKVFNSVFE